MSVDGKFPVLQEIERLATPISSSTSWKLTPASASLRCSLRMCIADASAAAATVGRSYSISQKSDYRVNGYPLTALL